MLASFETFAHAAAPFAVRSLWQGLAVAVLLALGLRLAPRITAAQRFAVWIAGFAVVLALPFWPLLAENFAAAASPSPNLPVASPGAWLQLDPRWTFVIAALWLLVSLGRAADLFIHTLRLRSLWRSASPVDVPHTAAGRRFEVCTSMRLDRPSVIGFFAPRILIPGWLFARLTPGELDQVVLHESGHLSRRDDWTNLLQKLCLVVFPLSPALWWIDRRLAREREMACDEGVIRVTRAPRAYAACLANMAERGLARRIEVLSLGAFERRPELIHRVHSILRNRPALHPAAARTLLAGLACALLAISFELAQCPQLVAFVPTEPVRTVAAFVPASAQSTLPLAVRALPSARAAAPAHRVTARHVPSAPAAAAHATASEQLASIKLAARPAAEPAAQQWIVFTAWEQVESAPAAGKPAAQTASADYDTVLPAEPGPAKSAPSAAQPQRHIRVTQLILKVLPPNSRATQPAAVPLGSGWFVIQL